MYVCASCECLVPKETRKECQSDSLELEFLVVGCHSVGVGNPARVLCKSRATLQPEV